MDDALQCWACKRRRVRCDFGRPSCSKCIAKGIACPGYSSTKPRRWKHYVSSPSHEEGKVPQTPSQKNRLNSTTQRSVVVYRQPQAPLLMLEGDVAPAATVLDALVYYVEKIVPDLAPIQTWKLNFHFGIDDWLEFDLATRHLYICVVALHRAVQNSPFLLDDKRSSTLNSHEMAMVHHHQACAARLLSDNISTASTSRPDQQLLRSIHMFLSSHIQQGAYTPWRSHLSGAHGLLALWGPKVCMGEGDFVYFMLMMTNVFGTTTTPSHLITEEIILQHHFYLEIIDDLRVDFMSSLTPVPPALVKAVAKINMLRTTRTHEGNHLPDSLDPDEILSSLERFSCDDWATIPIPDQAVYSAISPAPFQQDPWSRSWEMLVRSFRDAAILYLIISTSGPRDGRGGSLEAIRNTTYRTLQHSIDWLFGAKLAGGTHHKFVIWPMVISGVEAVYVGDEEHLKSLRNRLQSVSRDLGTLAMRDAAVFLGNLWDGSHKLGLSHTSQKGWDDIFSESPLFLM